MTYYDLSAVDLEYCDYEMYEPDRNQIWTDLAHQPASSVYETQNNRMSFRKYNCKAKQPWPGQTLTQSIQSFIPSRSTDWAR